MLVSIKERMGQSKPSQIVCSDLWTLSSVEMSTRRSTSQNQWTPGTLIPTPRPRQRISLSQVSSPKGSSLNTNTGCGYKVNESTVLAVEKKKKRMLAYFTQHLLTRGLYLFLKAHVCLYMFLSIIPSWWHGITSRAECGNYLVRATQEYYSRIDRNKKLVRGGGWCKEISG